MLRLLRALLSVLALPVVVTGLVPYMFLIRGTPAAPGLALAVGVPLLVVGLGLIGWTVSLFFRVGQGTLAPWDPPRHLVLRGPYRHVRNPMISGVVAVLLGEAGVFLSPAVLVWAGLVLLINAVYIPLAEEPGLLDRFGADYAEYCRHVPRWLPRLTPWNPPPS